MTSEMWAVIGSITGVAVGGAVSFITQWITLRAETRRHQENIKEARRTERLTEIINYLKLIQQAEAIAVEKHDRRNSAPELDLRAAQVSEAIWTAQRTLELLCEPAVSAAAHDLSGVAHRIITDGSALESVVWEIRPFRRTFIEASRQQIINASPPPG